MTKQQYDMMRNECRSNSCYHCYCNGTNRCFMREIEKTVKDFPTRNYDKLDKIEKLNLANLEVD